MLLHGRLDLDTKEAVNFCVEQGCWPTGSRYYRRHSQGSDWDFFHEHSREREAAFAGWVREQGRYRNHACYFHRGRVQVLLVENLREQILWRNALGPLLVIPKKLRPLLYCWFNETVMMLHGGIDDATKNAVDFCVEAGCWPMGSRYYGTNAPGADWDFFDQYSEELKQKFLADGWEHSGPGNPPDNAICFFRKGNVQVQLVENLKIQVMLRNCLRYWLTIFPKSHRHVVIWSFYTIIQQTLLSDEQFFADPRNTDKTLNYSDLDFWRQ